MTVNRGSEEPDTVPRRAEDADSDFGFGSRVAQQSQRRLLNRDDPEPAEPV
jgi:hypothetical protein